MTTIERHLARAEALAATLSGGHQERAQAVLEALALLKVYCADLTTARAVAIAWAVWDELNSRALRPTDAEIAAAVRELGVRGASRALNVPRSTVSRIARDCPTGTPTILPPATPACTVGGLIGVMEEGGGVAASGHCNAPADLRGADRMLGNGSKRPQEIVSPQAAIAILFARLERLEKLPANAEEAAKFEAERLAIRARLAQERFALIDALAREGVTLAARAEKARRTLDYASGPAARAAAQEALQTALLEQASNSCAQELRPAALAKELMRTADPRLRVWQAETEFEIEVCACYEAPFVLYTQQERERIKREAAAAPVLKYGDDPRPSVPGVITIYPRLSGAPDQKIYDGIAGRRAALTDLKLWLRDEAPLQPFTADEVTREFERRRASIPKIPDGASQVVPAASFPKTYTVDLNNLLTKDLEALIIGDTPREAPRVMPPDGTRYINGVAQT